MQLYGVDVSQFQGNINWDALNASANFVIIRVGDGTILDTQFKNNQEQARSEAAKAGPLGIGYYYFADPTLLDAITSANWFCDQIGGSLNEGEVLMLDLEGQIGPDPVGWSLAWLKEVERRMGAKPLIYLNQSEVRSYNWTVVINNGNGLWLADYDGNKTGPGVETPWPVVAIRQWTDADHVNGVPEAVDGDTFYGSFNAFDAYGYHAAVPAPEPPATQETSQPEPPGQPAAPVQEPAEPPVFVSHPVSSDPPNAVPEKPTNTLPAATLPVVNKETNKVKVTPKWHQVLAGVAVVCAVVGQVAGQLNAGSTVTLVGALAVLMGLVEKL